MKIGFPVNSLPPHIFGRILYNLNLRIDVKLWADKFFIKNDTFERTSLTFSHIINNKTNTFQSDVENQSDGFLGHLSSGPLHACQRGPSYYIVSCILRWVFKFKYHNHGRYRGENIVFGLIRKAANQKHLLQNCFFIFSYY